MPLLRRSHSDDDTMTHDHDYDAGYAGHRDPDRGTLAARQHEEHGGFKLGAAFFGWLVAIALTVLLAGIAGAVATAVGVSFDVSASEAEQQAGNIGIAAGVVTLILLLVAYFAGGYVAGRLARFDGARQGLGVWVFGLVVALIVAGIGAVFGSQYDVFDRIDMASLPSADTMTLGGIVALAVVLVVTLVAAILGGKAGQRYHTKVDRTPL